MFRQQTSREFLEEVDIWVKDLTYSQVNFEELDVLYQRAISIRLRDDPKNRYPMGIYEIIVANQELRAENQEKLRREKLERPNCQECIWAKQANIQCRIHGEELHLAD